MSEREFGSQEGDALLETTVDEAFGSLLLPLLGTRGETRLSALDPQDLTRIRRAASPAIVEMRDRPLGLFLPTLTTLRHPIAFSRLDTRSANVLRRADVRSWHELAAWTPEGLMKLRNAGIGTVHSVIDACIEAVLVGEEHGDALIEAAGEEREPAREDAAVPKVNDDALSSAESEFLATLRLLAEWAMQEATVDQVADVWELASRRGVLPPDIARRWSAFVGGSIGRFAPMERDENDPNEFVRQVRTSLSDGQWSAHQLRVGDGLTLAAAGEILGVTRERVRQLQAKAEEHVSAMLEAPEFHSLRWRAWTFRREIGSAAPLDHPRTSAAIDWMLRGLYPQNRLWMQALLLKRSGPYVETEGWLRLAEADTSASPALLAQADEFGVIAHARVDAHLDAVGVRPEYREAWLSAERLVDVGPGVIVPGGTLVDRCVALLSVLGEPATAEALMDGLGEVHSLPSVRDRLRQDTRVVRASRRTWGLRAWGIEEYSGIVDELAERISARGGWVDLESVALELSATFDVRASSVHQFAHSPLFVVEGGRVRLRRDDEPLLIEGEISQCRGVFRPAVDRLSLLVPVDETVLRGSGQPLRDIIARELGVLPGMQRVFRGPQGAVTVSWPVSAALGPSLGSVRLLASAVGADRGDLLRLEFDTATDGITASGIGASQAPVDSSLRLALLSGIALGPNQTARLAASIGVPVHELRDSLRRRGDDDILALLGEDDAMDSRVVVRLRPWKT